MGEPRGPESICPYNIGDALAAEIYRWGGESLGVRYYFPGDKWKACEIGSADWPTIAGSSAKAISSSRATTRAAFGAPAGNDPLEVDDGGRLEAPSAH
jgi:hypothetical protein